MKAITFSLILAVIISSVSVGWFIDFTYEKLFSPPASETQKQITLLKLSGRAIADLIEFQDSEMAVSNTIKKWQQNDDISVNLFDLKDFAIPASLLEKLQAGEALLLENSNGPSFSFLISDTQKILQVSSKVLIVNENKTGQFLLTLLFYFGISLLLTAWAYPLAKRLFLIKQASINFGKGNLQTRIDVGSVAGIRDVELAFNLMASRIQTLLYDIRLLSGGVSHDLKTSLARLRFGIDTIEDARDTVSKEQLERLSNDTDDMIRLVDSMLQYTKLDTDFTSIKKDDVRPTELLHAVFKKLQKNTQGDDINIKYEKNKLEKLASQLVVLGNADYLQIMLHNILSNAVKYATNEIRLSVHSDTEDLYIEISDDGPGIEKKYQDDVFKPFFRVPKNVNNPTNSAENTQNSRNHANQHLEKHYGLGLAVSVRIAQIHGGSIALKSQSNLDEETEKSPNSKRKSGTQFKICLPLTTPRIKSHS